MATSTEEKFKFSLDIHFAQKLAGNVTKIRDRTVKKLKRWIAARSAKDGGTNMEAELLRLWKGLFYCMWMCDKPVVQEELADKISDLIHNFSTPQGALTYFDAFLLTMKREWVGIDRLRMDKYFMFIRRCFRQALVFLKNRNWDDNLVDQFMVVLCKTPLSTDPEASPDGLRYHFIDIYREELARCSEQQPITNDLLMKLLDPFCVLVTATRNKTLVKVILRGIFQDIVDESDVGFPEDSEDEGIDSGEDDGEGKKETQEKIPEKKKKNMRKKLPKLQYDYQALADRLFDLASRPTTSGAVRRKVYDMVKKFRDLKEGIFPDYNVESLIEYQDDDDKMELMFGNRMPREKKKKETRRGGKKVREKRLAKKAKTKTESSNDEDVEDEVVEERRKTRRRKKKKREAVSGEMRSISKRSSLDETDGLVAERSNGVENGSTDQSLIENGDFEMKEAGLELSEPGGAVKDKKNTKMRKSKGDQAEMKEPDEKLESRSGTQVQERDLQERKVGLTTKTGCLEDNSSSFKDLKDTTDKIGTENQKSKTGSKGQLQLGPVRDQRECKSQAVTTPSLAAASGGPAQRDAGRKRNKSGKFEQPFAAFQQVKTPPALVRRKAVRTDMEPQTEPRPKRKQGPLQLSEDTDGDQPTPKKRVKIALGLNKAHGSKDYVKQLKSSPHIPFDSLKKPRQSVLKTPSPGLRSPKRTAATTSKKRSLGPSQSAAAKTASPILKTPKSSIIKKTGAKSSSKKGQTPSTLSVLRRSSRIKTLNHK